MASCLKSWDECPSWLLFRVCFGSRAEWWSIFKIFSAKVLCFGKPQLQFHWVPLHLLWYSLSSRLLSHWFWLSQAQVLWLLEFSYKRMNLVHCRGIMSEEVCGPNSTTNEYPCLLPPPLVYRHSVSPPSNLFKDVIVFEVLHSNTSWFHHLPFTSMVMEFRSLAPLENQNIIYHDLNKTTCWTLNFSLHRRVIICKKDSLAISPLFWLFWILLLLCNYFY